MTQERTAETAPKSVFPNLQETLKGYIDFESKNPKHAQNTSYAYIGDARAMVAYLQKRGRRSLAEATRADFENFYYHSNFTTSMIHRKMSTGHAFYTWAQSVGHVKQFKNKKIPEQ